MTSLDDVRRIALALPGVVEKTDGHRGGVGWRVPDGLFAWERPPTATDLRQLAELGRTWPDGPVIGIRTEGLEGKDALLGAFPEVFFTIPHFEGYSAVLVRLDEIDLEQLHEVVTDSWLLKAPKRVAREWLDQHPTE